MKPTYDILRFRINVKYRDQKSTKDQLNWYSLKNMRQLQILFIYAKDWHRIVCWFLCIYLFLPVFAWCCDHKIVLFWSAEQFYDHIMQKLVKTGKNTEINTQSDVKFWLNWIKYWAVSYSLTMLTVNGSLPKVTQKQKNNHVHCGPLLKMVLECGLRWHFFAK